MSQLDSTLFASYSTTSTSACSSIVLFLLHRPPLLLGVQCFHLPPVQRVEMSDDIRVSTATL